MHRAGRLNRRLAATLAAWILLALSQPALAGDEATGREAAQTGSESTEAGGLRRSKNPTGAFLRSLVIPGWGQAYTGHWFKAAAFFGTEAGMLYGISVQNRRYLDNLDLAEKQKTDTLRRTYEEYADFYRDDRNKLIWWTAGVTLLAAFDAFVEAHLYGFHIDPSLGTTPQGDGPAAGITIRF